MVCTGTNNNNNNSNNNNKNPQDPTITTNESPAAVPTPSHLHGEDNRAPSSLDEVGTGGGDDERGACGLSVGPEEVGAHARYITHVVPNIVGDCRRVARVILRVEQYGLKKKGAGEAGIV